MHGLWQSLRREGRLRASPRLWGWWCVIAGLAALAVGGWTAFFGTFSIGFGLTVIGGFSGGVGVCLLVEPWAEEFEAEIDRWEENWSVHEWSPQCPVHGSDLCHVRTRDCPGVRQRMDG
jgi:hypothetical protein